MLIPMSWWPSRNVRSDWHFIQRLHQRLAVLLDTGWAIIPLILFNIISNNGAINTIGKPRFRGLSAGVLVVFVAGFSPIPHKAFTICAGVMQMAFFPFLITALFPRCLAFIGCQISAWGGWEICIKLRKSIEVIGWSVVVLAVVAYLVLKINRDLKWINILLLSIVFGLSACVSEEIKDESALPPGII